jgi:hypothetical protein
MTGIKVTTLPVVDHGSDRWGLPTRLSVPVARDRPISIRANGKWIGEVAVDGTVKWTGPNASANFSEYCKLADALAQAAKARSRLRVAILDGKVSAIVVPPGEGPSALAEAPESVAKARQPLQSSASHWWVSG